MSIPHGPSYIYSGPGTWDVSVAQTQEMLETVLDSRSIKTIPSLKNMDEHPRLVVIPGGSAFMCEDELACSAQVVSDYVRNGGKYLGICSGAIVATQNIILKPRILDIPANASVLKKQGQVFFEKATQMSTFLNIYPGRCVAPYIVNHIDSVNVANLCAVEVRDEKTSAVFKMCHYSGPLFYETPAAAKILLRYNKPLDMQAVERNGRDEDRRLCYRLVERRIIDKNPVAALSYNFGRGKMVLTGVHPEINPETFPKITQDFQLPKELEERTSSQKEFIQSIFQELELA